VNRVLESLTKISDEVRRLKGLKLLLDTGH
jgi:hypothetical protein